MRVPPGEEGVTPPNGIYLALIEDKLAFNPHAENPRADAYTLDNTDARNMVVDLYGRTFNVSKARARAPCTALLSIYRTCCMASQDFAELFELKAFTGLNCAELADMLKNQWAVHKAPGIAVDYQEILHINKAHVA